MNHKSITKSKKTRTSHKPLRTNRSPKIVTLGGGTGAPIIIQALLLAGYKNISCICASMDSGGKTGIIRSDERDQVIAISDLLRNLLALIPEQKQNTKAFTDLVSYIDGRQRNLGYTIYYALLEKYQNNFLAVQNHLEKILDTKFRGHAIPVTIDSSNIFFKTKNKSVFKGEHELDKQSMSKNEITKIWINPPVLATQEALKALQNATHIIFCPGSLYGSIISNFLPTGIKTALKKTKAKKILITNLVSNRNQTHKFTPHKYLKVFQKYTKLQKPFDYLICPNISQKNFEKKHKKIAESYSLEHSHFHSWTKKTLEKFSKLHNIKVARSDIISITPHLNRLRHDPAKLSQTLKRIID